MRGFYVVAVLACFSIPLFGNQQQDNNESSLQRIPPPEIGAFVRHEIGRFGSCAFFTKRGVRWQHGFADGSALEVRCEPDRGHLRPGYHIWFIDPGGKRVEVAHCIFDNGFNRGWYYTPAVLDGSAKEPYLAHVVWQTIDAGKNDGGLRPLGGGHFTGPEEPYVDVVLWVFDAQNRKVECIDDKYQYAKEPLHARQRPRLPTDPRISLEPYIGPRVAELRRSFVAQL